MCNYNEIMRSGFERTTSGDQFKVLYCFENVHLAYENSTVVNSVLLKCRKLRREDQETSDWIVSRISLFYDMSCYL